MVVRHLRGWVRRWDRRRRFYERHRNDDAGVLGEAVGDGVDLEGVLLAAAVVGGVVRLWVEGVEGLVNPCLVITRDDSLLLFDTY